ncbi:hypothetical protein BDP27DRAFT_1184608, partial [Rhodocollybia butyracea]
DTKEVEEMLKDVDKDLEEYETEISLLQSRILYIKSQQTRLKEHVIDLRSLNSPIRKVPNEILFRIFDYACNKNLLQEFPFLPAMSVSSVCTRWRLVALSSSAIWSRISLELSPESSTLQNCKS